MHKSVTVLIKWYRLGHMVLLTLIKLAVFCFLRQVRERLKEDVEQMKLKNPNFRPGLVVLQVSL